MLFLSVLLAVCYFRKEKNRQVFNLCKGVFLLFSLEWFVSLVFSCFAVFLLLFDFFLKSLPIPMCLFLFRVGVVLASYFCIYRAKLNMVDLAASPKGCRLDVFRYTKQARDRLFRGANKDVFYV